MSAPAVGRRVQEARPALLAYFAHVSLGSLLHTFADRSGIPVPPLERAAETAVSSISYDSRKARPGSVFVALRGLNADGTAFAREAITRGAVAAL